MFRCIEPMYRGQYPVPAPAASTRTGAAHCAERVARRTGNRTGPPAARYGRTMGTAAERLERELAVLLRRSRAISREMARQVHPDLEPEAYSLLVRLDDVGSARPSDLAGYFGIGKPTLSRQVQLLEQLGLLTRRDDPSDRRAVVLTLSENGRTLVHRVREARRSQLRTLIADWDEADVEQFATLLHRLTSAV